MGKKRSYTALRRKFIKKNDLETCVIKDRYENQIITKDPLFHGKERLTNMQSITDFRVVNEVRPEEQTEFPPVPQDIYSSLHLMRYYPIPGQISQNNNYQSLSAKKNKSIMKQENSNTKKQKESARQLIIEDVDNQTPQKYRESMNEMLIEDESIHTQTEITQQDSMRKSELRTSKVMPRRMMSEKKPTMTCRDKEHMKTTEAFRRSTKVWSGVDDDDLLGSQKKISIKQQPSKPVIISPTKRNLMERNRYTLLRVQSQQMQRKNTSQMRDQQDQINQGRPSENVLVVTPVKTLSKKESKKLLSSTGLTLSQEKQGDMEKKKSSMRHSVKNKDITLKKSEIRELTRKITELMQNKGDQVANKEINYQNKKISLDKFVDLCNKHFTQCDHFEHEVEGQI